MTTATQAKTKAFAPGDRVYYSSPDHPGRITAIAKGEATVQVEDGRTVTAPVDKLTLLPNSGEREWQVGDRVRILEAARYVGELATITDTEPPAGCFVVPDSGMFSLYVSHSGLELVEAAPDDDAAMADYLEQPLTEAEREILDSELERLYPDAPAIEAEIVAAEPIARLAELEADITEGLGLIEQGKAKIWAAVAAVRSEELWRTAGHPSFEAYCAERWNWKKANGHENALAGEVLEELVLSGVPVESVPTSTSAMSQLAKAPAGDRAEVLHKAATLNGGKVTEAAVRQALKPEPLPADYLTDDEAVALGITVYRSDTSPEAIAEGLERGWLVPTAEHRPSPADSAHAAAAPGEDDQSSTESPPPALEPSGGSYEVGTRGTLKDCPHSFVVAGRNGNSLELWNATQRMRVHESEFTPYANQQHPYELEIVARGWLRDMVDALGPEQVRSLLEEVA